MTAADRFCNRCGSALTDTTGPTRIPEPPAAQTVTINPFSRPIWSVPQPTAPTPAPRRRRTTVLWAALATAVVVIGAAVTLTVAHGSSTPGPIAATDLAAPPTSRTSDRPPVVSAAAATTTVTSLAPATTVLVTPAPVTTVRETVQTTVTTSAPPKVARTTARPTSALPPDSLMGGRHADIGCASGWVLQIASETSLAGYQSRVAQLQAVGEIPYDAAWTEIGAGCPIFTPSSSNPHVYVSWSGPYGSGDDACTDRFQAPPDAFIRSADPASKGDRYNCACSPVLSAPDLPGYGDLASADWTADLQTLLTGDQVGLHIGDLAGGRSAGDYTAGTTAAVAQFQQTHGLVATGIVDVFTWQAVVAAAC